MVLLYLYIPKYGIFEDAEFNFSDKYTFSFDSKTRVLKHETKQSLPDDFFSLTRKGPSRVVDCVSALIGNNGSGKTSIAYFISDILSGESTEHLIIWASEKEGQQRLFCHHMLIPNYIPDQDALYKFQQELLIDNRNKAKIVQSCYTLQHDGSFQVNRSSQYYEMLCKQFSRLNPIPLISMDKTVISDLTNVQFKFDQFSFVYCTNNYGISHGTMDYKNVIDLSSGFLMREDAVKYHNDRPGSRSNYSQANYHDKMEFSRMTALFSNLNGGENRLPTEWALPKPRGVVVSLYLADAKQIKEHLIPLQKSDLWSKSIEQLHETLTLWAGNPSQCQFPDLLLYAFLGNWLRYHAKGFSADDELNERFCNVILTACSKIKESSKSASTRGPKILFDHLYELSRQQVFRDSQSRDVLYGPDTSFSAALQLYNLLLRHDSDVNGATLYISLLDDSKTALFLGLTKYYFNSFTITPFIDFTWHPRLSAGELAQYSIFSRLFNLVASKRKSPQKNIILFFDEIEITIHPHLQRRLVENVVVFLESLFSDHNIHVIFASHSPILLSDIPSSNVCCLKKDESATRVFNAVKNNLPETFGANIHSLYRHSFFLDGLIGSFAQQKINSIITEIQGLKDNASEDSLNKIERLILIVGEPFIRQQLLQLAKETCPKSFKQRLLSHQLRELDERKKALEAETESLHD